MKLGPTVPLAATLLLSGIAGAFAQAPQQGAPPCFNEFMPLRTEAEKRADAIQAAGKRKAPIEEVCGLFKRFYEAEDKVVKYAVTNATFCGIPEQAVKSMKASHEKTLQIRNRVCNPAAAAAAKPRGPSLSDVLGTTIVPDASTTRTGPGTYDTLTGNPLKR
jgi:hypothetical protein